MKHKLISILGLFWVLAPGLSLAQNQEYLEQETRYYSECMELVKSDPEAALDMALTWRETGGALPARHCVAAAQTALGKCETAAIELETLADEMSRGLGWYFEGVAHPNQRGLLAEVYAQGGNAWMLAGDPIKAFDLFTVGLSAAEEGTASYANLLIDRALAQGEMGEFQKALDDLSKVQTLVKENADLYVLKASAYRALGQYPMALAELDNAFRLDPESREGLLERGNLRREMGDKKGARENWITYLRRYPDGPDADLIRKNLENMDVRIDENQ